MLLISIWVVVAQCPSAPTTTCADTSTPPLTDVQSASLIAKQRQRCTAVDAIDVNEVDKEADFSIVLGKGTTQVSQGNIDFYQLR